MSSTGIEQSNYLRRVFEAKMAKMDPKLSFHDRMKMAMSLMDAELGEGWRKVEAQGDPSHPFENNPVSGSDTDMLFSKLHKTAEEEGLPPPPESMRQYGETVEPNKPVEPKAEHPVQQPLVIIVQNRIKANGSNRKSKPNSSR